MTVSGGFCQMINTSHERTTQNLFHADADITKSLDGLKHFSHHAYFVYYGTESNIHQMTHGSCGSTYMRFIDDSYRKFDIFSQSRSNANYTHNSVSFERLTLQ